MLEIIKAKFNIRLNGLAEMRIENNMMLLDLTIFQKLLSIFTPVIQINHDFE